MAKEYLSQKLLYYSLNFSEVLSKLNIVGYFKKRRDKMLDFYIDHIQGKPEHEKPSAYKWAYDEDLIGDVPTAREIPGLEKRLEKRLAKRIDKTLGNLEGLAK